MGQINNSNESGGEKKKDEIDPELLEAWKLRMARNDLSREVRKSTVNGRVIQMDSMTVRSRYIYNEIRKNYNIR